jgi:hypothetical protein
MLRKVVLALFGCLPVLAVSPLPAAAVLIDTTVTDNGGILAFGDPNTATFGQLFTVSGTATVLDSFSLYLRGRVDGTGTLDLRGYIAGWNGSLATNLLYASSIQTMNADGTLEEFNFAPAINLVSGETYVAFLSLSEIPYDQSGGSSNAFRMPFGGDSIPGGFVFQNNGHDFDSLFDTAWTQNFLADPFFDCGACDVWFKASFSERVSADLPEPGTLLLFGAGLAGIVLLMNRQSAP